MFITNLLTTLGKKSTENNIYNEVYLHNLAYMTCGKPFLPATCSLPSSVRCIVTHLLGLRPDIVTAIISASSSSRFSFNFLTRDSIARFAKVSSSPPWTAPWKMDGLWGKIFAMFQMSRYFFWLNYIVFVCRVAQLVRAHV